MAHHKFYGQAVTKTRRLDLEAARLTFSELVLASLGAFLGRWRVPVQGTKLALKVISTVAHIIPKDGGYNSVEEIWPTIVIEPLLSFFADDESAALAVSLGRRRPHFLPSFANADQLFFGLTQLKVLLHVMIGVDAQIELLRRVAQKVAGLDGSNAIIKYRERVMSHPGPHFTTVFPAQALSADEEPPAKKSARHKRWVDTTGVYRDIPNEKLEYSDEDPSCVLELRRTKIYENGRPKYAFLFGIEEEVGLWVDNLRCFELFRSLNGDELITYEDMLWCLQSELVRPSALKREIQASEDPSAIFLKVMATISQVYHSPSFGGATIPSTILDDVFSPPIFRADLRSGQTDLEQEAPLDHHQGPLHVQRKHG